MHALKEPTPRDRGPVPWRWVLLATALGTLCLLTTLPVARYLQVRQACRKLSSEDLDVRTKAANDLIAMGTRGRLALLDYPEAAYGLAEALRKDAAAGRNVAPLIREAARLLNDQTDGENDFPPYVYADIASIGWSLGLLDQATEKKLIQNVVRHRFWIQSLARPEYPLGKTRVCVQGSWELGEIADSLSFSVRGVLVVDGKDYWMATLDQGLESQTVGSSVSAAYMGVDGCGWVLTEPLPLGRHTVKAGLEITLAGIKDPAGKAVTSPEIGWKRSIYAPPTTVVVRDDLPPDYLQAKVTPGLRKTIAQGLHIFESEYGWERRYKAKLYSAKNYCDLRMESEAPVDLCYKVRWEVEKTGKTFDGIAGFLMRGDMSGDCINEDFVLGGPPNEFLDTLPVGSHRVRFKVTLEPDFDTALEYPDVMAYWPLPIKLPPIEYEFEVKEAKDSDVEQ